MGLMGSFFDRNGMRDDHFDSRTRKALADENNRTKQEQEKNVKDRAQRAKDLGKWSRRHK